MGTSTGSRAVSLRARDLPSGQEEWLAALAAALWPRDEYARIIAELWREDRP